eukprot:70244-Chlamydomonas_euryale.AAC.1
MDSQRARLRQIKLQHCYRSPNTDADHPTLMQITQHCYRSPNTAADHPTLLQRKPRTHRANTFFWGGGVTSTHRAIIFLGFASTFTLARLVCACPTGLCMPDWFVHALSLVANSGAHGVAVDVWVRGGMDAYKCGCTQALTRRGFCECAPRHDVQCCNGSEHQQDEIPRAKRDRRRLHARRVHTSRAHTTRADS